MPLSTFYQRPLRRRFYRCPLRRRFINALYGGGEGVGRLTTTTSTMPTGTATAGQRPWETGHHNKPKAARWRCSKFLLKTELLSFSAPTAGGKY